MFSVKNFPPVPHPCLPRLPQAGPSRSEQALAGSGEEKVFKRR